MRFEDLTIGEIMMMPDHVFGRQWWTTCTLDASTAWAWAISMSGLPERIVVWGLSVWIETGGTAGTLFYVALGDVLPTTLGEFAALGGIIDEFEYLGGIKGAFAVRSGMGHCLWPMRKPVQTGGGRLVMQAAQTADSASVVSAGILVSSFPTGEVPVCLL